MAIEAHNINYSDKGEGNPSGSTPSKSEKKHPVLSYILLPGIIPQFKEIMNGGFGYLAFLIAMVYQAVRILPRNHPYTKHENIGKFGIVQTIAQAANHVQLNKKNIDQIIVFFSILVAMVILALQFFGLILMVLSGTAFAQTPAPESLGLFTTANPDTDIAFFMLREVFGLPDMFGTLDGGRTNLQIALQTMFEFYNLAILIVAIIVFIYYIIVVVGETAQSGTPFGQRFSHIYAPIRLVIAIGLLVPLNYGFNGAQYITFYAAKLGSGFATNGWNEFNNSLIESNPLGAENATLLAESKAPDIDAVVKFMAVIVTCREAYALKEGGADKGATVISAYLYSDDIYEGTIPGAVLMTLAPDASDFSKGLYSGTLDGFLKDNKTSDIRIVFASPDYSDPSETPETVKTIPYCGSIVVPVNIPMNIGGDEEEDSLQTLQSAYIKEIFSLWNDEDLAKMGKNIAKLYSTDPDVKCAEDGDECFPPKTVMEGVISKSRSRIDTQVLIQYEKARKKIDTAINEATLQRGWAGAGIWYNRIAQMNGAYVIAVRGLPTLQKVPTVMDDVIKIKQAADAQVSGCTMYDPNLGGDEGIIYDRGATDFYYSSVLSASFRYWTCDTPKITNNFVLDLASAIFGLSGLLSIRDRFDTGETNDEGEAIFKEIHPLAKLSVLGKGLIESAISSLTLAIGFSVFSGLLTGSSFGPALGAFSSMFVSIATIGLSIGFITYYILPFLPFMYFFFAMGSWIKSIFEAMVGAPLWALAHLRIDGDGLPGKMAMNGYLLILEIFLRPIMTIFGLLGGMAIFTALAGITNEVFDIVVQVGVGVDLNTAPDDLLSMHIVDVFFFTSVYAIILYMMAVSSFKMINLVPNNILRWIGQNVSSFSDTAQDSTEGLTQYAAIGGARIGGQLAGGISQGAQGMGAAVGGPLGKALKDEE